MKPVKDSSGNVNTKRQANKRTQQGKGLEQYETCSGQLASPGCPKNSVMVVQMSYSSIS